MYLYTFGACMGIQSMLMKSYRLSCCWWGKGQAVLEGSRNQSVHG